MRLPTPAWLVALKVFAFRDRGGRARRDLQDVEMILSNATDVMQDRIFGEIAQLLEEGLAFAEAGPLLLGMDLARQAPAREYAALLYILTGLHDEPDHATIARAIAPASPQRVEDFARLLAALQMGLRQREPR